MTEPLMTIGSYADAVGMPASAVRYYDEIGLLTPDHVDPHTGYRYYSTTTVRRARRIKDLREAGMAIEVMRRILDGTEQEAITELRALADQTEQTGARTAATLRHLADELADGPGTAAVEVDGAVLADAIRAASEHTGDSPPFDCVVLAAEPTGLDVIATNTYSLFAQQTVAPSTTRGRLAVPVGDTPALAEWLERQKLVRINFAEPGVAAPIPPNWLRSRLHDASGFPDHLSFLAPTASRPHRVLVDRSICLAVLADSDDLVTLEPNGEAGTTVGGAVVGRPMDPDHTQPSIRFTTRLFAAALRSLPGAQVAIDFGAPSRPCLLISPTQPSRTVVVMPARPDA